MQSRAKNVGDQRIKVETPKTRLKRRLQTCLVEFETSIKVESYEE